MESIDIPKRAELVANLNRDTSIFHGAIPNTDPTTEEEKGRYFFVVYQQSYIRSFQEVHMHIPTRKCGIITK